ncbi:Leucine-rich repeat protein kinase family protein [Raphanus sativus]|uniref:Uncharacterized protein LOC108809194 n=1 Tax=Raphanus sativus TaxID=3726 RepID=A0A6J0JMF1_RAPSA|nr:uncharacterized protein LOC108809194 [Raphanus sativus]KAJ4914841.1 Leucine-rich repeat protein kinase family protein [Raphanus sativus]
MGFSDSSPTSPKTFKEEDKKKNKGSANLIKDGDIDESDSTTTISSSSSVITLEDESVVDVSGQSLELSLPDNNFSDQDSVKNLYFFRNVFTLIPKSVGGFGSLKKLKFFSNEIDLFPPELGSLVDLEHLQVKISSPSLLGEGLSWEKLKALKELELTKVPKRSSALTLLSEISGLKSLTRLSVSHFSIRYLPAEIGCLTSLEYLDLSFNKIKSLPNEISYLTSLTFLKVAHNRLIQLPSVLALLQNLETLDVSNNRLTTLDPLDLSLMPTLQILNLQFNKLPCCCSIPAWIQCNLGGNYEEMGVDTCSSMSEMDVYETPYEHNTVTVPHKGSHRNPLIMSAGASSISRCFSARKSSKRWKRRQHYYQQRARQERLNNSRKWKGEVPPEESNLKMYVVEETGKHGMVDSICLDDNYKLLQESETEVSVVTSEVLPESSLKKSDLVSDSSQSKSERDNNKECCEVKASSSSSSERKKPNHKSKRCYDEDLDNPKASKCHRPSTDTTNLSYKYSNSSFCSTEDSLPDGFFDAGRDRPFMPLSRYEKILPLESREVILLDRAKDEELDAITSSARALVARLKKLNRLTASDVDNNLQVASYLALFVSDHFGGSDRTSVVQTTRKAASGSNYQKPFICTCLTGNQDDLAALNKHVSGSAQDVSLSDVCETSLRSIKSKRNSIVVPLGKLQFGICRHRALLMKFLCDRMEPPVPCELVRGYLDFMPHAWNVVPVKRGDSWVRMVVDACRPHDIREITDQEYLCRYIPLNRLSESICKKAEVEPGCSSISSLSTGEGGVERANSSLIRCKLGSTSAALKMRTLEVSGASSVDEIRTFEYTCLGEVRILGELKHDCIVELYGHEISSKWITSENGNEHRRILQSSILMEYIEGGSLKGHIEKLSEEGKHHVPMDLALSIARDVSGALVELHSKDIIHRDIKSENVLIDLDNQKANGEEEPVVKLCDFDRAVPLRSHLHGCCIAHVGIPPANVCVGTPRWMSPEVFRAMHEHNFYGLEVDIWSFGCLIFELLTLQIPYYDLSELQIHESLQKGKRPKLPEELETLISETEGDDDESANKLREEYDLTASDLDTMRFLIDVFRLCTEESPLDRLIAGDLHEMILSRTKSKSPPTGTTTSTS